jgi:hypothetical protein
MGLGAALPVARTRCAQRTAVLTAMLNRRAAILHELPAATAHVTRKRRSSE